MFDVVTYMNYLITLSKYRIFKLLTYLYNILIVSIFLIFGGMCLFSYTKPTYNSFTKFFLSNRKYMKLIFDKSIIDNTKMIEFLKDVVQPKVDDYIFFKIVTLNYENKNVKFIGYLNGWFCIQ